MTSITNKFFSFGNTNRINMPNTDHFQKNPDFYSSSQEGKSAERIQTNHRYKFFKQTHFTAGDYEQFLEYWDRSSHVKSIVLSNAVGISDYCPLYKNLSCRDVIHTFEYIFHKFKKGIFFKIVDNNLKVFLPFSKIEYTNEWSDRVNVDTRLYKNIYELMERSSSHSGHSFDPNRIHYMKDHWYANNGLLRYEYPISENDSGVSSIRDMLMTLCKERSVPDGEYFINKRDFPILKRDKTETYDCIYGENTPLLSHNYDKYCPILGMTTTDEHADIAVPTWDDWARVMFSRQKFFGKDFLSYPDPFVDNYKDKIDTAVFRGASTGLGTTIADNPRLYFTKLSREGKKDVDGKLFLDCAITKWNCRPRKNVHSAFYDTIHKEVIEELGVGNYLSMQEQSQYKFILHLPGHSEAYRLPMELATGSVILLYPCRYRLWFSHLLKPYTHYVPLDPTNPHDVFDKIQWCKQHPLECEKIASNARQFYVNQLSLDAILNYWQRLLVDLQQFVGKIQFPFKNMFDYQQEVEEDALLVEQSILHSKRLFPFHANMTPDLDLSHLSPRSFQVFLHKMDPHHILQIIDETPIWKQSKNVVMKKIVIAGKTLCVKTPIHVVPKDISHECFVGQIGLNKLANVCPMVSFQYGKWGDSILTDFVMGDTLEKSIYQQKTEHVCQFVRLILCQISILLHHIQSDIGFIHYDLYPWNIVIHENTEGTIFRLPINHDKTITFKPAFYPVLIDFGKSHIVYKNMHFANISPFHLHLHQDILSILVSTMFIVIQNHKIPPKDMRAIVHLVNYVGQTRYSNGKRFDNITQIKQFLKIKKKYSNMLMMDDKTDFKDMDPIRLFEYIHPSSDLFSISNKPSPIFVDTEIHYSRLYIVHELSIPNHIVNITTIPKNPVHSFYTIYMNPDPDMDELVRLASMEWKIIPHCVDKSSAQLPRFFSHPDPNNVGLTPLISRYYERRKMYSIISYAFMNIPQLAEYRDKIQLFSSYLKPILPANSHSSIVNHLALYNNNSIDDAYAT